MNPTTSKAHVALPEKATQAEQLAAEAITTRARAIVAATRVKIALELDAHGHLEAAVIARGEQ